MIISSLLLIGSLAIWAWYVTYPERTSREITATFFGFVWSFHAALIIHILLPGSYMPSFPLQQNLFYGVPLGWVITQAIILGALGPLVKTRYYSLRQKILSQSVLVMLVYTPATISINLSLIWVFMLMLIVNAIPAWLLSNWTRKDTCTGKRALLQSTAWAVFLFWFFPSVLNHLAGTGWSELLGRSIEQNVIYSLPLLLPGYLLINALYHFAVEGGGTAFPYDAPRRLVTRGVYQYISNPMQVGICLAMAWWGVMLENVWVLLSSLVAVILFVVFKNVCNGSCAIGLNNPEWEEYQRRVPKWWPRLK